MAINPGQPGCVESWGGHRVVSATNHGGVHLSALLSLRGFFCYDGSEQGRFLVRRADLLKVLSFAMPIIHNNSGRIIEGDDSHDRKTSRSL